MGRPPVPDSLTREREPDDFPAVPAGRRGGTSASAEREFRCISRCRNPRRTGGCRWAVSTKSRNSQARGYQISTRRLGSRKTSR